MIMKEPNITALILYSITAFKNSAARKKERDLAKCGVHHEKSIIKSLQH